MRKSETSSNRDFSVKVFAGTHTVLLALNCSDERRKGLMGFSVYREVVGGKGPRPGWLRSRKVFKSVVPNPDKKGFYFSDKHPIQGFLWGDYGARPGTTYRFRVVPRYGAPTHLTSSRADEVEVEIRTEDEWPRGAKHGVWFNRGAIASQRYAEKFDNKPPKNIDDPNDPAVKWLSRGLLEACLGYINETKKGDALRVAAYEFTYPPILNALKALIDKGIDVQIVYHDTTKERKTKQLNETAMKKAGLPVNDRRITFRRTKTKIPHNKFIVRLKGGNRPVEVWTGSTNFTRSGFLGQTNVGHRVADVATAKQYLTYWNALKADPTRDKARKAVMALTPSPQEVIPPNSSVRLFSPRPKSEMLEWYGRRMIDAANSVWFTAAFGVTAKLVPSLAKARNQMRFVLMEKPATAINRKALTADYAHIVLSYGTPLGQLYKMKDGKPTARRPIANFALDKWFFKEELYRPKNDGFVFFVHTKFLLIDPLSDDPLVCSGSANFSPPSLLANDENMMLIRGDTRIADIYMTEFDRIFRHFYFRNIANELARKGRNATAAFLDESDIWTRSYFKVGFPKYNRRQMFFSSTKVTWADNTRRVASNKPARKTAARKKKLGASIKEDAQ